MKKIKIITGITWSLAGLILIVILFPALNGWSASLSKLPFMKINPNYTGGEVVSSFLKKNCTINIHRPVFDGLIRERHKGFVQVDWHGEVPDTICDSIDYNNDKIKDFIINVYTQKSQTDLKALNTSVKDLAISTPTSYGWSVRINLVR
jgi:hypothetical protein